MSLLSETKIYLDISDNDRDGKITQLLNAGYSSMTKTADVVTVADFSPTSDTLAIDDLYKVALFLYVAKELETDADQHAKWEALYERQVSALAMSSAFGDFSSVEV